MSLLFPRFTIAPVRCAAPVRHQISPLWSLFDDATRQIQQLECQTRRAAAPFNPRFDLKEDKESYILEGEVPGFQESDLSIEWNNNVLAIRGRHESVVESGKKPEAQIAVEDTPASETGSIKSQKSHQATVEDEDEPANASAVTAEAGKTQAAPQPAEQAPAKAETAAQAPKVQHWISERRSGQFSRQFAFPSNAVNHEAIKASLQSGILKIVVPKAPVPESRHINIE